VPKGGAKTPLATGHGIEGLTRNNGVTPRVFQVAGSKDQAQIGTDYAEYWVNGTDEHPGELAQWIKTKRGSLTLGRGEYKILSSDGRLGHGRKPTIGIVDEWWLFASLREREAYTALESALHKEPESYLLAISTEGWDPHSQLAAFKDKQLREAPDLEVRRDGCLTITRDREQGVLLWWYGAPEDFDPAQARDEELLHVIKMCNPGSWVDHREQLRAYHRTAEKLSWQRLTLNQRTKTEAAWLPAGTWPRLVDEDAEIPDGSMITIGIDAAYSDDCTAVAWAWHDGERIVLRAHAWTVHRDQPGEYVSGGTLDNEALVEPFIHQLAERYQIAEIVFDPRYFASEAKHLDAKYTIAPIYPQSNHMREAEQEFKKAALAGRIAHDGDDVLASHVESVVWKQTGAGGKIDKLAGRKIDAATASVMAVWRAQLLGAVQPFFIV
jgi:phage terminase large subunit-like protein